jgi:hypothetical protein
MNPKSYSTTISGSPQTKRSPEKKTQGASSSSAPVITVIQPSTRTSDYGKREDLSPKKSYSRYHSCMSSSVSAMTISRQNAIDNRCGDLTNNSRIFQDHLREQSPKLKEKQEPGGYSSKPRPMARTQTSMTPRSRELQSMSHEVEKTRQASTSGREQLQYTNLRNCHNRPPGASLPVDRERRRRVFINPKRDEEPVVIEVYSEKESFLGKLMLRRSDDVHRVVTRFCESKSLSFHQEALLLARLRKVAGDEATWSRKEDFVPLPPPFDPTLLPKHPSSKLAS